MCQKHVMNLFKQAIVTFPYRKSISSEIFNKNLEKLKSLMDQLTKEHVNLDEKLLQRIHPGHKLPLHDHPQMHGLLKVIAGTFKIQAYSEDHEETLKLNDKSDNETEQPEDFSVKKVVAKKLDVLLCDENSECCILTPGDGNYHEIEPVNGSAAFLDILSPPYDAFIEEFGQRDCTYYKEESEIKPNLVQLTQIRQPAWFWCDTAQYSGPLLSLTEENTISQ
ncbi:2-aminoethanethiol dioxygenase-like [Ctenocephalides felis]|uniref:2-aminoethanethiol dioxygenase-like n=1 Tax=Ctenocephalides felis TaxID=7515 RepID=UPI000E6E44A8|nr:2-aminoethanethiol dioxygenase-like [Ctenocephalides felis]